MTNKNNKQGFTLIELLVVIAIIGLLSTLSILALNTARARARDVKRVADVKQIQTALEMYYNEFGQYPATANPGDSIGTGTNVYLKVIPKPPIPTDNASACSTAPTEYTYAVSNVAGAGTYTLQYCLGATVNEIPAGLNTASNSGIR
ncbi:MAG: type II secretion system protein [Patescibacteria group bacterium]